MKYCGIKVGNFGDDILLQLLERLFPAVARQAGLVAINPRNAPHVVIERRCSRVLAESLHSGI